MVNYLVNNSGNEVEVSPELKLNKTSRAKYEGTMRSFERAGNRSMPETGRERGSKRSGISIVSGNRFDDPLEDGS